MLRSIVILSIGIMMIFSVMVLSLGVDDAFAGKGTVKVFVSGFNTVTNTKVPLASCEGTSNFSTTASADAKGNGVVHLDFDPDPGSGTPITDGDGTCELPSTIVVDFDFVVSGNGPVRVQIDFP